MDEQEKVYLEKFKTQDEKIEKLSETIEKVNTKMDDNIDKLQNKINEVNKKTDTLENTLSNRLTQIEVKFDVYNGVTNTKLDKLEQKLDNLITKNDNEKIMMNSIAQQPKENKDSFKEFLYKRGEKFLDLALYSGVLYAIAKGLKLF